MRNNPIKLIDPTGHDGCGPPNVSDVGSGANTHQDGDCVWVNGEQVNVSPSPGNEVAVLTVDGEDFAVEISWTSEFGDLVFGSVVGYWGDFEATDDPIGPVQSGLLVVKVGRTITAIRGAGGAFVRMSDLPTLANGIFGRLPGMKWLASTQGPLRRLGAAGGALTALEGIFELGRMAIDPDVPLDSRHATSSAAQTAFGASMAAFYMTGNPAFGVAALFSAIIWVGTDHSDLFWEAFQDSAKLSGKTIILNPW